MIFSANESATATTAGALAVEINYDMAPRRQYVLTAKGAALWFSVIVAGGSGASIGGATSHYLAAGEKFPVAAIGRDRVDDGTANARYRGRISIIRDGGTDASGILSETPTVQPM